MPRKAHASGLGPPPAPSAAASGARREGVKATSSPAPEWAVTALDKVDDLVAKVRASTTDRLVGIVRAVVFGLLALIMGSVAGVLGVIALVRGLDELIPGPVWGVYLLLGAIFTGAGGFLWSKKAPRTARR